MGLRWTGLRAKSPGFGRCSKKSATSNGDAIMTTDDDDYTDLHDVAEALEACIQACDPTKREALALALDGYHVTFPEDFHWAISGQAPRMLWQLFSAIDYACHPESPTTPRPVIRLVDRKPPKP
jgi:hypothetical protein